MVGLGLSAAWVFHGIYHAWNCNSAVVRATHFCSLHDSTRPAAKIGIATVLLAAAVGLAVALGVWCLRPLDDLTSMVRRLGPQNLAERAPVSPRRDEAARLSAALNEMMDRLAAGYEGQRSFAANASHELRTPLAVQRTLIEVSMAGARSPEQVELLTEQLLATNERNERLIEGLLVLSESDRGLISRTPQRLDEIAAAVVDAHRDLATKARVVVRAELSECVVLGEQVLLERLVTNLVCNAITYNVEDGEVVVQVGGDPALVVENTGGLIAGESVAGLFEPFRRGSSDRTHHGGGAGLGLTIVRSICQAHDGSVQARPGPRGGLRVEVVLPAPDRWSAAAGW
jgi:signal transduction histidine kinase